jgi:hypothetical protein
MPIVSIKNIVCHTTREINDSYKNYSKYNYDGTQSKIELKKKLKIDSNLSEIDNKRVIEECMRLKESNGIPNGLKHSLLNTLILKKILITKENVLWVELTRRD